MSNKHHEPPLKPWVNFSLLIITKITNIFIAFMKGFFAICIVASLSFLTYSSLSGSLAASQQKHHINIDYENAKEFQNVNVVVSPVPINRKVIRTNLSHIVFGISGTAKTWEDRRYYIESWWRPNVTRGFVWLDEPPATWPASTSPPYHISGDTKRFKYTCSYGSRAAIRIARIVKETFELGLENVRWFVMGDDDTVFFLENLVTVLGKYDHRQMYYIGGNSESTEQNVIHSYTTGYGGGGFAISYPLAVELVKILDGCIDRYASFYGSDQKIGGCMSEIGVSLTKELGFHQVDLKEDIYGFLAAHPIAPLVSLHHLDYIKPIFPGLSQIDSIDKLIEGHEMDPGRTLQQSFCYDLTRNLSLSVSWGYTVQIYPYLVPAQDLATPLQTFFTWRSWSNGPFEFNTRPFSDNPCERPVIYFMDRVEEKKKGRTLSFYKRYMDSDAEKDCEDRKFTGALSVREIRVSAATFELDMWKKAPRRQCSEIVSNPTDRKKKRLSINIRGCKDFESVTPP